MVTFSTAKKTKISVTHDKRIREVVEYAITFTEEDADGLLLPHNDALVISLNVLDLKIKHVLVDPGNSANIIKWGVLESWIHEMNVVPSIYHQLLKFPTPEGIKQIRGDQPAGREMNAVIVSSSKGKETSK
ncbi:uncharacterized protein [Nicotiana sylvestris]|uniref:uncharacterized protein n=1 Tax=Nicotiana sylvestris TaxID=4096 RepID=UPI00388CA42F